MWCRVMHKDRVFWSMKRNGNTMNCDEGNRPISSTYHSMLNNTKGGLNSFQHTGTQICMEPSLTHTAYFPQNLSSRTLNFCMYWRGKEFMMPRWGETSPPLIRGKVLFRRVHMCPGDVARAIKPLKNVPRSGPYGCKIWKKNLPLKCYYWPNGSFQF